MKTCAVAASCVDFPFRRLLLVSTAQTDKSRTRIILGITMRIQLDAKDLIDVVEHGRPMSVAEFGCLLRERSASVAVGNVSVLQFVAPLVRANEFSRMRALLQGLETLPLTYIASDRIPQLEINEALVAFREGREPVRLEPFGTRWDDTFYWPRAPRTRMLINIRLDQFVESVFTEDPRILEMRSSIAEFRAGFAVFRSLPDVRLTDAWLRKDFGETIWRKIVYLRSNGMWDLPIGRDEAVEAGYWMYDDPARCSGLRLQHECYFELMKNKNDVPKDDDLADFIYVGTIPYVDFTTLDRRMLHYVCSGAKRLASKGNRARFDKQIFRNLAELIENVWNVRSSESSVADQPVG